VKSLTFTSIAPESKKAFIVDQPRTFDSVNQSLSKTPFTPEEECAKGGNVLAIEAEHSETCSTISGIDFSRILYDDGNDFEAVSDSLFLLKLQKDLNERTRRDPQDVGAWLKLASLFHNVYENQRSKCASDLIRSKAILDNANIANPDDFDIKENLLNCTIFLDQLRGGFSREIDDMMNNFIYQFVRISSDRDQHRSEKEHFVRYALNIARKRLQRLIHKPGLFNYDDAIECFKDNFRFLSKIYGGDQRINRSGPGLAYLFLDLLRFQASMGYSERSCGLIQAVLDINLSNHGKDSCRVMFKSFWESEFNRLGESFPAGYDFWTSARRKLKGRTILPFGKCSDGGKEKFQAGDFVEIRKPENKEKVIEGYSDSRVVANDMNQTQEKSCSSNNSLDIKIKLKPAENKNHRANKARHKLDDVEATEAYAVDAIVSRSNGDLIPSTLKPTKPNMVRVYSIAHGRSIEVSSAEVSSLSSNNAIRKLLNRIKGKNPLRNNLPTTMSMNEVNSDVTMYEVNENDEFLEWAQKEQMVSPSNHGLFNVPKKNNNRINIGDLDSIVLYEDGIGDMVIPFLTDFNESGLDSLLMCCLTWLGEYFFVTIYNVVDYIDKILRTGVSFPRSMMCDANGIRSEVLSLQGSGHDCLNNLNDFGGLFSGVFEDFPDHKSLYSSFENKWHFVYYLILMDEKFIEINPSLFNANATNQLSFLRHITLGLAERIENSPSSTNWLDLQGVIFTIILAFEQNLCHDITEAREKAKRLLGATEASKNNPRLWIAYAQIESKFGSNKKTILKILIRAISCLCDTGISGNTNEREWLELCLLTVNVTIGMWFNDGIDMLKSTLNKKGQFWNDSNRDHALHILCCFIEEDFSQIKKKAKPGEEMLVSFERFHNCSSILKKKFVRYMSSQSSYCAPKCFDPTPIWFYHATFSAWIKILTPTDPSGSVPLQTKISEGLEVTQQWIDGCNLQEASNTAGLSRLIHFQLQLALLKGFIENSNRNPANTIRPILMMCIPNLLKNDINLSPSILMSLAIFEVSSTSVAYDFSTFLGSKFDLSLFPSMYHVLVALLKAEKYESTKDCIVNGKSVGKWSKKSTLNMRKSLRRALTYPSSKSAAYLWKALIRFELLSGSEHGSGIENIPAKALSLARNFFEEGISSCVHSKSLWLDAFTILRPMFSSEDLLMQIGVIEEKGIRLLSGTDEFQFT